MMKARNTRMVVMIVLAAWREKKRMNERNEAKGKCENKLTRSVVRIILNSLA